MSDGSPLGRSAGPAAAWRSLAAVTLLALLLGLLFASGARASLSPNGRLTGEGGETRFGQAVALAGDGSTAVVGAPDEGGEGGAVWVFTRTASGWTRQAILTPKSGEENGDGQFGASVAISANGNTVLVGAPADAGTGAVWAFKRTGATWVQQGERITAAEVSANDEFGRSIALSAKGETAIVGAPGDGGEAGAIWAFTRSEGGEEIWSQQGLKLTPESGEETGGGRFGASVALSAEGDAVVVGAPADDGNIGAAWVLARVGSDWAQQGPKLTAAEEVEEGRFGASVAVSAEAETALIGGPGDNHETGAAWSFARSGSIWTPQGKFTAAGAAAGSAFGTSVALSATGDTALVGGPGESEGAGAAWVFTNSEGAFAQRGASLSGAEEAGKGRFGSAVALSADAAGVLVGGPADSANAGAAWAYAEPPTVLTTPATSLTRTSATLNATVNPNGGTVTDCHFEYGTSTSYGESVPCAALPESGATTPKEVSAPVTGLLPNTKYYVRIAATSGGGTSTGSVAQTFETLPEPPTVLTGSATSPSQTSATLNATVNPNGAEVSSCSFEYGPTESYGSSVSCSSSPGSGSSPVAVSALVKGLGADKTYHFRIVATNAGGTSEGSDGTLETLPDGPAVVTGAASALTQSTATLGATVNPNDGEVSECEFEYGPTASYGSSAPCKPEPGSGGSAVEVSAALTGLSANSTYHFRVVATNPGGTSEGSDGTFKTLPDAPAVVTGSASAVTEASATLSATVNPKGGLVSVCKLEYGPTESYGSSVPCSPSPGSGGSPVAVSAVAKGLSANTTYHFRVLATNAGGTSEGSDGTFKTLPEGPTVITGVASAVTQTTATLGATVNPNGGEVSECEFEYGPTASYGTSVPCKPSPGAGGSAVEVSAGLKGLTPNSTYHFRVVATNAGGTSEGSDGTFKTLPDAPAVVTGSASAVAQTSATLNATVNPNGGKVSKCRFEYGEGTSYGSTAPCSALPGSGSSPVAVSADVTGLSANTTYHFRIVATNAGGTSEGSDETLNTPPDAPTVVTGAASAVAQTTATLSATVDPDGGEVSECRFEYGPTASYGTSAPCKPSPGSGGEAVEVSAALKGLSANSTYHFRVVATNAGGTSEGSDGTFKTLPDAPVVVTGEATAVAQASATLNATVNPKGGSVSACKLEYGTSASYGSSLPCTPSPGSGSSPVSVSASVTGLSANTTYHFRIVATNAGGASEGSDETFKTPPDAPTAVTLGASAVTQTTATLGATVNPNGGEVSECEFEYGPTASYGSSAPCKPEPGSGGSAVEVSAALKGLSPNSTYHFRVVAKNAGGTGEGSDGTFKTLPDAPAVVTGSASAVVQTTATLNATVNPNGGKVSKCYFEYGEGISYGSTAPCSALPGSGSSPVAVSADVTGLSANTTYHFRVVATNAGGTSEGSDGTFRTLPNAPTVVTGSASTVTQVTATLGATVNPNGGEVSECEFEYGPTASYGTSVPCKPSPGSGGSAVEVSAALKGLSPNSTYHFRVVAKNAGGTGEGSDGTFKTLPDAPTVVTGAASTVVQTSATLNATVNPNGGSVTTCKLEYGTSTSYGSSVSCSPPPGSASTPVAVSANVTGLSANTTYHFRVVATNAGGTGEGSDATFKTLPNQPVVVTGSASAVAQTTATLNANVNPNGGNVSACYFEYGESTSYGSKVACTALPGSGTGSVAVSAVLAGLVKNTTYHFRIVATNPGGTSAGLDQSVETAPGPPTVIAGEPSSVGQTSAMLNAEINPNGGVVERCYFHYEGMSSGSQVVVVPCVGLPLTGKEPRPVSALAEGLSASTRYTVSLEVINSFGEVAFAEGASFETAPGPSVETTPASSITQTSAILNATVDPNGGEVTDCHFEYGPTDSYGEQLPCTSPPGSGTSAVPVSAALAGLAADTPYYFRVVAITAGGESKDTLGQSFQTLPDAPTVATGSASAITQTTASLSATVNPNGGAVSDCKLEYGTSTAYGESAPCSSPPGSGKSAVSVSAALAGLGADTTYHFRVVAANAGGLGLPGADGTFTTLPDAPTVVTTNASSISQSAAILSAVLDPNGGSVSACKLEYGPTESYGSSVSCLPSVESASSNVAVSAAVLGLSPNTTYHFRVVAVNVGGTGSSGDESFTTAPVPTPTTVTTDTSSSTAKTTGGPKASCTVSLASTSAVAKGGGAVAIKLVSAGAATGTCSGRLTLAIDSKGRGKRAKSTPIGTAAFSLAPGKAAVVMVKLDKAGRLLLAAGHGRLSASLTVLESAPVPSRALSAIVRVVREQPPR